MKCKQCGKGLLDKDHFSLSKKNFRTTGEYFMTVGGNIQFCDVVCLWKWCESDGVFGSILQVETGQDYE